MVIATLPTIVGCLYGFTALFAVVGIFIRDYFFLGGGIQWFTISTVLQLLLFGVAALALKNHA